MRKVYLFTFFLGILFFFKNFNIVSHGLAESSPQNSVVSKFFSKKDSPSAPAKEGSDKTSSDKEGEKPFASKIKYLNKKRSEVLEKSGKIEGEKQELFKLHIACADKLIELLQSYEKEEDGWYFLFKNALKELKQARELSVNFKLLNEFEADLIKTEKSTSELKEKAKSLKPEQRKSFDAIIFCLEESLAFVKKSTNQEHKIQQLKSSYRYLKTAERIFNQISPKSGL